LPRATASSVQSIYDRTLKLLFQEMPEVVCRLAGMDVQRNQISRVDPNVNMDEMRADHVFRISRSGHRDCALHVEYQANPDRRLLKGWALKNAVLNYQLGIDLVLVVIYLRKGRRKQFPSSLVMRAGGLESRVEFVAIRLWEHSGAIRSGELGALAVLLVLCEDTPQVATLQEEREIIRRLKVSESRKRELLGLAVLLGSRFFPEEVLMSVFRDDIEVLKDLSFVNQ
jgi:hypothetical protein